MNQNICYLCGNQIDGKSSDDHVPPKQFFPKEIRQRENLNLKLLPCHKECNNDFKNDEEYFYASLYPLVEKYNLKMGQINFNDISRRCKKPQLPKLIRGILKNASDKTKGGIFLPSRVIEISLDLYRLERIAIKIARGILFIETNKFLPLSNTIDIRMCEKESDVPEQYQLSWQGSQIKWECPEIFSYRYFLFDDLNLFTLFFWGAFTFCITIRNNKEN